MTKSHLLASLLALLLVLSGLALPASAQDRTQLPSQRHPSLQSPQDIEQHTLPSVNTEALQREDQAQADEIGPYRYGTTVDTDFRPEETGTWERLPSGAWLWRLRIQSRDAVSLSVAFTRFDLPPGAEVFVHGPDQPPVHGPYTAEDATGGQHWTPLVHSEELIVELTVPANQRGAVDLTISNVVHGYRSLFPSRSPTAKSGACNIDVACEEADPWRRQVRSVGRYTYELNGDAFLCTGSLVNNTSGDKTPYFLTAEHCVSGPETAETMVFYWNYQNETCRTPGSPESGEVTDDDPLDQTSSGAVLRARYGNVHDTGSISGKPDLTLVEIDDQIPKSYGLYFNGWSREDQSTAASVTIHHPQGHGKRISFDDDQSTITAYGQNNGGETHLRIGDWERGTTEGGSSGSPLYDTDQRAVGVLSGGLAGCDSDGDIDDNDEPDWYGRLAAGFNSGDYQDVTFADFLDPTDSGAATIEGQNLSDDSVPPARPLNFRVDRVTPDSVTLTWTAPGDDSTDGTADQYRLRYKQNAPITSKSGFDGATEVNTVPAPKPAGTPQSATVSVNQDTSYYFALVALDKVQNASPLARTDRDVTPVAGLRVTTPPQPNPTQGRTTLRFVVEERQPVRVELYDALGRRVEVLYDDEPQPFRRQTISSDFSRLSSGMYFVRIRGENAAQTEQIAIVK